jgi:hypothetical protein
MPGDLCCVNGCIAKLSDRESECKCYCRSLQCFLHLPFLTCFEDTFYTSEYHSLTRQGTSGTSGTSLYWADTKGAHPKNMTGYSRCTASSRGPPAADHRGDPMRPMPCRSRVGDSSAAVFNFSHDEVKPWKMPLGSKTHHFWRVWFTEFLKTWGKNIYNYIYIWKYVLAISRKSNFLRAKKR